MKSVIFATALTLALSGAAQANLISNGGFEAPSISGGWTYLSDAPGGWQGDNIEVWKSGFNGVNSYEGSQHGELNSHPYDGSNFSIYQTFDTMLDATYDYSLAYRARSSNNESFRLEIFTGSLGSRTHLVNQVIDDHTTGSWSDYANVFTGSGITTFFMLTSVNPNAHTVGNFIDAISVTKTEVPEPGSIALITLGLVGLISVRRQTK